MDITPQQKVVLVGIARGDTNAEIAKSLWLSEETVRTHSKALLKRMGARNRAHAVHLGFVHGYLQLEDK